MKAAIRRIGFFCADRPRVRRTVCCLAAVLALLLAWAPVGAQNDEDFMAARDAFRTGNRARLDALEPQLRGHVLYSYVDYWRMRQRLDESAPETVREAMARLADGPLADRLRNDWLKSVARRGLWDVFDADRPGLKSADAEVTCYGLQRALQLGEPGTLQAVRKHCMTALFGAGGAA